MAQVCFPLFVEYTLLIISPSIDLFISSTVEGTWVFYGTYLLPNCDEEAWFWSSFSVNNNRVTTARRVWTLHDCLRSSNVTGIWKHCALHISYNSSKNKQASAIYRMATPIRCLVSIRWLLNCCTLSTMCCYYTSVFSKVHQRTGCIEL